MFMVNLCYLYHNVMNSVPSLSVFIILKAEMLLGDSVDWEGDMLLEMRSKEEIRN